jgi:hypothetical protein
MLSGSYANSVLIGHSPSEFFFDFITGFYPNPAVSRAGVTCRRHTFFPRFLNTLRTCLGQLISNGTASPATAAARGTAVWNHRSETDNESMLLKIVHETNLTYSAPISESTVELRVQPRQEQDQHRLSFSLAIGPPSSVSGYFDWLGNHVQTFKRQHRCTTASASSQPRVVETDRAKVLPERFKDTWPIAGFEKDTRSTTTSTSAGAVVDSPSCGSSSRCLAPQKGMSLGELALRMIHLIDEKFVYWKGVTTSASPITDALTHGKGVCQTSRT